MAEMAAQVRRRQAEERGRQLWLQRERGAAVAREQRLVEQARRRGLLPEQLRADRARAVKVESILAQRRSMSPTQQRCANCRLPK
jgi:hypothetical protein